MVEKAAASKETEYSWTPSRSRRERLRYALPDLLLVHLLLSCKELVLGIVDFLQRLNRKIIEVFDRQRLTYFAPLTRISYLYTHNSIAKN